MPLDDVMQPLFRHWGLFGLPDLDGQAECVREWLTTTFAKLQERASRTKGIFASLAQRTTPASPA